MLETAFAQISEFSQASPKAFMLLVWLVAIGSIFVTVMFEKMSRSVEEKRAKEREAQKKRGEL